MEVWITSSMRQTYSASASGGMHQDSTIHGLLSFFSAPAVRSRCQSDRPGRARPTRRRAVVRSSGSARGGITASQLDQPLLNIPLDFDLVRPRGLPSAQDGDLDPFDDQLATNAGDGARADTQGSNDLLIGAFVSLGVVGKQENARVRQFPGSGFATGNQLLQVRSFLCRQSHPLLVHCSHPIREVLPPADRQETGYCFYLSNEDG